MSLKNSKYFELIKQNIETFKLDLDNYNILLPACPREPALLAVIAAMAGAKNVYVQTNKLPIKDNIIKITTEFGFENIKCIDNPNQELLSQINIVVKGGEIEKIDSTFIKQLNKKAVITLFPENLDFTDTENIDLEAFNKETASVVGIDPDDKNLNLYKYFSHILLKRCYEAGLDVYKSRLLLVGHGNLLDSSLQLLKAVSATVYSCNIQKNLEQFSFIKRLSEIDAIIVMDYPQTSEQVIGSKGLISISDIVDLCPNLKIIHFSGKLEETSLNLGKIKCFPDKITQNSINLNIRELGEKGLVEITTACLKVADSFIKSNTSSMQINDSIVIYKVLNKVQSILLGRDQRGW
ncbi:MAG: hypothetical protein A2104_01155 [Candidatus Melainabacteria bacterium GWF2_32_7]|nr:MAG: hypothetical protein A2104_01155 [Candidatus Melainabacteria bacterium GWF2_32_7]